MTEKTNGTCGTSCGCKPQTEQYWQDVENKVLDPKHLSQEFSDDEFDSFSIKKSRRNFLKIMGFSVASLPMAGCVKIPVRKAIPYLEKNDTVIPGVANWYASTISGLPVLVKTREGRPIKLEGNKKSTYSMGGVDTYTHGYVFSLYDSNRLTGARKGNSEIEWDQFDTEVSQKLQAIKESGKEIVVVTPSISSPSELAVIEEFSKTYSASHIAYDAVSYSAWAQANQQTHGTYTLSEYNFSNADVVVSFGYDFLNTVPSEVNHSKHYSKRRDPKQKLNKHIQIENFMSLTGSNADLRFTRSLKDQRNLLVALHDALVGASSVKLEQADKELIAMLVNELKASKGRSLVLGGENNKDAQVIVNKINDVLGNYGSTVKVFKKNYEKRANDSQFNSLITRMKSGKVGAVLLAGVNPVYSYADEFSQALSKVSVKVSFALAQDETSILCDYNATSNHVLESWSDTQVSNDELSMTQPTIQPLFGSRMWSETLLSLAGVKESFYDFMRSFWKNNLFSQQNKELDFESFWNKSLHDGVVTMDSISTMISTSVGDIASNIKSFKAHNNVSGMSVSLYQKTATRAGDMANNPWLQEVPDPITKATWDNYAMLSPSYARAQNIKSGDVVEVKSENASIKLPAIVQPGTAKDTVAIAVGYGRKVAGKVAKGLGANAFVFSHFHDSNIHYTGTTVSIKKTGEFRGLAQTQTHHSMEGRDIVRETTFAEYSKNPKAGNKKPAKLVHIYPEHDKSGHQWAMSIDLNKCDGCSACIISCNAENNIPVVGKKEVANRREMHWMRLDRYYKGDEENPEVVHMPMLCQHCENAPCENVCPVLATVHSSDGINQQIYNRCVGTRYCANNCPYKVRRFNWFQYDRGDELNRMALNPDISVRSRGVMEKCSFCVQRIQEGKLKAKKARRKFQDGDVQVACQQSCPSDAIIFGDKNDPNSKISQFLEDERNYVVLGELNVQPRVSYMTKVRNK